MPSTDLLYAEHTHLRRTMKGSTTKNSNMADSSPSPVTVSGSPPHGGLRSARVQQSEKKEPKDDLGAAETMRKEDPQNTTRTTVIQVATTASAPRATSPVAGGGEGEMLLTMTTTNDDEGQPQPRTGEGRGMTPHAEEGETHENWARRAAAAQSVPLIVLPAATTTTTPTTNPTDDASSAVMEQQDSGNHRNAKPIVDPVICSRSSSSSSSTALPRRSSSYQPDPQLSLPLSLSTHHPCGDGTQLPMQRTMMTGTRGGEQHRHNNGWSLAHPVLSPTLLTAAGGGQAQGRGRGGAHRGGGGDGIVGVGGAADHFYYHPIAGAVPMWWNGPTAAAVSLPPPPLPPAATATTTTTTDGYAELAWYSQQLQQHQEQQLLQLQQNQEFLMNWMMMMTTSQRMSPMQEDGYLTNNNNTISSTTSTTLIPSSQQHQPVPHSYSVPPALHHLYHHHYHNARSYSQTSFPYYHDQHHYHHHHQQQLPNEPPKHKQPSQYHYEYLGDQSRSSVERFGVTVEEEVGTAVAVEADNEQTTNMDAATAGGGRGRLPQSDAEHGDPERRGQYPPDVQQRGSEAAVLRSRTRESEDCGAALLHGAVPAPHVFGAATMLLQWARAQPCPLCVTTGAPPSLTSPFHRYSACALFQGDCVCIVDDVTRSMLLMKPPHGASSPSSWWRLATLRDVRRFLQKQLGPRVREVALVLHGQLYDLSVSSTTLAEQLAVEIGLMPGALAVAMSVPLYMEGSALDISNSVEQHVTAAPHIPLGAPRHHNDGDLHQIPQQQQHQHQQAAVPTFTSREEGGDGSTSAAARPEEGMGMPISQGQRKDGEAPTTEHEEEEEHQQQQYEDEADNDGDDDDHDEDEMTLRTPPQPIPHWDELSVSTVTTAQSIVDTPQPIAPPPSTWQQKDQRQNPNAAAPLTRHRVQNLPPQEEEEDDEGSEQDCDKTAPHKPTASQPSYPHDAPQPTSSSEMEKENGVTPNASKSLASVKKEHHKVETTSKDIVSSSSTLKTPCPTDHSPLPHKMWRRGPNWEATVREEIAKLRRSTSSHPTVLLRFLPLDWKSHDVRKFITECGVIRRVRLTRPDPKERSTQAAIESGRHLFALAFVEFATLDGAEALLWRDGEPVGSDLLQVEARGAKMSIRGPHATDCVEGTVGCTYGLRPVEPLPPCIVISKEMLARERATCLRMEKEALSRCEGGVDLKERRRGSSPAAAAESKTAELPTETTTAGSSSSRVSPKQHRSQFQNNNIHRRAPEHPYSLTKGEVTNKTAKKNARLTTRDDASTSDPRALLLQLQAHLTERAKPHAGTSTTMHETVSFHTTLEDQPRSPLPNSQQQQQQQAHKQAIRTTLLTLDTLRLQAVAIKRSGSCCDGSTTAAKPQKRASSSNNTASISPLRTNAQRIVAVDRGELEEAEHEEMSRRDAERDIRRALDAYLASGREVHFYQCVNLTDRAVAVMNGSEQTALSSSNEAITTTNTSATIHLHQHHNHDDPTDRSSSKGNNKDNKDDSALSHGGLLSLSPLRFCAAFGSVRILATQVALWCHRCCSLADHVVPAIDCFLDCMDRMALGLLRTVLQAMETRADHGIPLTSFAESIGWAESELLHCALTVVLLAEEKRCWNVARLVFRRAYRVAVSLAVAMKGLHLVEASATPFTKSSWHSAVQIVATLPTRGMGALDRLAQHFDTTLKVDQHQQQPQQHREGSLSDDHEPPSSQKPLTKQYSMFRLFPPGVAVFHTFLKTRGDQSYGTAEELQADAQRAMELMREISAGTTALWRGTTATTTTTTTSATSNAIPLTADSAWRDEDDPASLLRERLPSSNGILRPTVFVSLLVPTAQKKEMRESGGTAVAEHVLRHGCTTALCL